VNSVSTWYSGWAGLAEESPWLERPRSFADLLSHADRIDPQDAELRQLYALLSAAIPEAIQGRQILFLNFFLLLDAKYRLVFFLPLLDK
jgi:hypothetical protein